MLKKKNEKGFTHQKIRNFSDGFTLIELLVVVAIISLLSSVVLASLNSARTKAKNAAVTASFSQINRAVQMDYNDNGNYAPDTGPGQAPRFVPAYLKTFDASYYCTGCQYDYNNWPAGVGNSTGTCVFIEIYTTSRKHAIDISGCPSNVDS